MDSIRRQKGMRGVEYRSIRQYDGPDASTIPSRGDPGNVLTADQVGATPANRGNTQHSADPTNTTWPVPMTTIPFESTLIDRKTVAAMLGVHIGTVSRMVKEGRLPEPVSLGGNSIRWRAKDIVKIVEGPDDNQPES